MNEVETVSVGTVTDWTDDQWGIFTHWLQDLLRNETVEVVFTKTDGTQRAMICTMQSDIISAGVKLLEEKRAQSVTDEKTPKQKIGNTTKKKVGNIAVWDVEAQSWRSFRVRSLVNVITLIMKYDYNEYNYISSYKVVF